MALTIEDLQPKPFKIKVRGVELTSQPVKLSHALTMTKLSVVFTDTMSASKEQIQQAEKDLKEVFTELIPELKDIDLDLATTTALISELMGHIQPSDNNALKDNKVELEADPKVQRGG